MDNETDNIQLVTAAEPADRWMGLRARLAVGLIFAGLFALAARLVVLQVIRYDEFARLAQRQQSLRRVLPARRGTIFDSRGEVLASSVSSQSVFADPSMVFNRERAAVELGKALSIPPKTLLQKLQKDCMFIWIKRHVTLTEAETVKRLNLSGVYLQNESKRVYPQGALAGMLIGFTDIDGHGLSGIELAYNNVLAGQNGFEVLKRDARQKTMEHFTETRRLPKDGSPILLTIDAYIQNLVEKEVKAAVAEHGAESGIGVVMDLRTGDILGMASAPVFDPNHPGRARPDAWRNRVVSDQAEMGSIFKPLTISGVIDAGLVAPDTLFDCEMGAWQVGKRTIHDVHALGVLDVVHVIALSSNIGTAKICQRLGPQGLGKWLQSFGLGQKTGIDLPGEETGIALPLNRWNTGTMLSASFGQEVAVTPIFVIRAYAAIGNGGIAVRPRVVKMIASADGTYLHVHRSGPEEAKRIMKPETSAKVLAMMVAAVNEGTCKKLKMDEFSVGAKTGTSQLPRQGGRGYATGKYLSSICAIAPADQPRVVCLVSIREPSKGTYYGATVAGPACRNILRGTLLYLKIPPRVDPAKKENTQVSGTQEEQNHENQAVARTTF